MYNLLVNKDHGLKQELLIVHIGSLPTEAAALLGDCSFALSTYLLTSILIMLIKTTQKMQRSQDNTCQLITAVFLP